jgi:integrase
LPDETIAETDARLGEVLGLIWEEIDLDSQTITIIHQLDRDAQRVP